MLAAGGVAGLLGVAGDGTGLLGEARGVPGLLGHAGGGAGLLGEAGGGQASEKPKMSASLISKIQTVCQNA